MKKRCAWANPKNELYIAYHDKEWGQPVHDDHRLFEMLILESFQAGLSWECVLNKREAFQRAFDGFDLDKVCGYDERKMEALSQDEGIIRNRLKIRAAVKNARIFREIAAEYGSFSDYLWGYTDGQVIYENDKVSSPLSDQISKDLKKRGMTFVGTTIIYAYLQAVGVIYSHEDGCFMCKKSDTKDRSRANMRKKELALEVIERLKKEYPDAGCSLEYDQAWKLLVSVRLAAQCTDARVNVVVEKLYEKYPDVAALAAAPVEEIEKIVHPCGLGNSKARDISACMKMLQTEYGGRVPDDFDALLKLPGVGRKSANLIMGDVFGKPAIVTDTHCIRLCNRIGLVDNLKEPKKVEMALWKIIPPEEGSDFCHRLVWHGRDVCTARTKPYCDRCCLQDICKKRITSPAR